jgi:TonB family protein
LSTCFDAPTVRWSTRATSDESFDFALWLTVAVCLHGAIAFAHRPESKVEPPPPPPLEVELTPATPKPVAFPESDGPAAPAAPARREAAASHRKSDAPRMPATARAGDVLTSGQADHADDPVSFVTDPEGASYGGGVVARGAVALHGTGTIVREAGPDRPAGPPGDALTAPSDLTRRPTLDEEDPCRGFFPSRADGDDGLVTLRVVVEANGVVRSVSLISEAPLGQGFGAAASRCIAGKRFVPALDRAGKPTGTATQVRIHFTR